MPSLRAPIAPVAEPAQAGDVVVMSGYGCFAPGRTRIGQARAHPIAGVDAHAVYGCACKGDSGGPVYNIRGGVVGVMTHTDGLSTTWITDTAVLPYLRALLEVLRARG